MAQILILAASATNRNLITTPLPSTIKCLLNARNETELQADCALTYSGQNICLPTYFCQSLLQGHILVTLDPDSPKGLLPLLTNPSYEGSVNDQQLVMSINVLLETGRDHLPKEETGELLYQRVHVIASTQELRHASKNFVKIAGGLPGGRVPNMTLYGNVAASH